MEQRLEEIQGTLDLIEPDFAVYVYKRDVPWLLGVLVDIEKEAREQIDRLWARVQDQEEQMGFRDQHIRILEKRVRELEGLVKTNSMDAHAGRMSNGPA